VLQRKRAAICLLAMLFNYRRLPYVAQPAWQRASESEEALEHGESVAPYFGIAFSDVGQLFAVFSAKRWVLRAVLRESGPMTIAELVWRVSCDYKNPGSVRVATDG
jgi:hypothetical protein